ncbi:MAG: urease accessory protein UreD [Oscillatoriales cyanobacterium]|nr:MAG: urease accessory protein UreD [Oscillatoriales cyanobacterium]
MSDSQPWYGTLELHYRSDTESDRHRTRLIRSRSTAPFKVQRSFYPEASGICHTVALHTAGGIVGGDRLSQQVYLESDAHVLLSTPAATKVYGSRGRSLRSPNGIEASQQVSIQLAPGAYLEWLPQETIVFEGAVFQQDLRVDLAAGATWCGWDIARFGRTARGEGFARGTWRSRTEVWRDGVPLWIDRQVLDLEADQAALIDAADQGAWVDRANAADLRDQDTWQSYHGLNQMPVVGTLLWIGTPINSDATSELMDKARSIWRDLDPGDGSEAGMSTTIDGIVCRYRGRSTSKVRHWFTSVWHLLRTTQRGQTAHYPRIW